MNAPLSLTALVLPTVFDRGFELAVHAERFGYSRYWVTEHFEPKPGSLGSSIVAATRAASMTTKIRVGTAGLLLNFYPVALAAIQLRSLAALFPGRIDAGFCRGGAVNAAALESDVIEWAYESKMERLIHDTCGTDWPPQAGAPPDLWSLGSSPNSARLAAHFGVGYAYGLQFVGNADDPTAIAAYRDAFRPSEWQSEPRSSVAVAGYCSDSPADLARMEHGAGWIAGYNPRILGSPQVCRDRCLEIAERYGVDELVFVNIVGDPVAAARSLELLADALSLPRPELP